MARKAEPGAKKKRQMLDYELLKVQFFSSSIPAVRTFFEVEKGIKWNGGCDVKTKGWGAEKKAFLSKILDQAKKDIEQDLKEKTTQFYINMQNAFMSHAQQQIQRVEIDSSDGQKVKVPVFKNIDEARKAVQEVRTFNGDTNRIRDWGNKLNQTESKLANIQFVMEDDDNSEE